MDCLMVKDIRSLNIPSIGSPGGNAMRRSEDMNKQITSTRMNLRKCISIATWNVQGLVTHPGKLDIIEREVTNINIVGLCETHWSGSGHYTSKSGNTIYFSGHQSDSIHGVAMIIPKSLHSSVLGYNPVSSRILTIKINAKPCKLNIVQIYAPTSTSTEDELNDFYNKLESTIQEIPTKEITLIQGDFNAKIGQTEEDEQVKHLIGRYGLGVRNESGQRLVEFCIGNNMVITNTIFPQHPRRRYTWTSPGGLYRNQIDYILVHSRWKSSIQNVKTLPGAECGSDHKLLLARVKIHIKSKKAKVTAPPLNSGNIHLFKEKLSEKLEAIPNNSEIENSETLWQTLKTTMIDTKEEVIQQSTNDVKIKQWMTDETWDAVKKRKMLRRTGIRNNEQMIEYQRLNKDIQRLSRRDKNQHLQKICLGIERLHNTNETRDLFRTIKEITREFKPRTWKIEDQNGKTITEIEGVLEVWQLYCRKLYENEDPEQENELPSMSEVEQEPDILRDEVEQAIHFLKNNKSTGGDNISAEMLKQLDEVGITILWKICNNIWKTGQWPTDWCTSTFIPLHKKGSSQKCDNYRTIALISHPSKVMLRILLQRLRSFLDWQIPQEQAGFVSGRGTREQISNVRQIIEKAREFAKPTYLCFLDYSKAFDCVSWQKLWRALSEMGTPQHLVLLLKHLYENSIATVRLEDKTSPTFSIQRGVRQGCILSPLLFNIYGEYIIRKALDGWEGGIRIGGREINNLRYADDTTLITKDEQEMAELIERVEGVSLDYGLKLNRQKTKLMVIDRTNRINTAPTINDIEMVEEINYLGANINRDGNSSIEIKRRIALAKTAMTKLQKIWKDKQITTKTKRKLVETLVLPIALYGAETWTLKAKDIAKLDSFEMWAWRRLLRIPWTAHRTNVSILEELQINVRLSTIVRQRILKFFGHVSRRKDDNLEKLMIQGKIEGKRPRGRSPKRWMDQMKHFTGNSLQDNMRCITDRDRWREITITIT